MPKYTIEIWDEDDSVLVRCTNPDELIGVDPIEVPPSPAEVLTSNVLDLIESSARVAERLVEADKFQGRIPFDE